MLPQKYYKFADMESMFNFDMLDGVGQCQVVSLTASKVCQIHGKA